MPATARKAIIDTVQQIPGLIQDQAQLAQYTLPDRQRAIPHIQAPKQDGLRCKACPYVVREVRRMQQHCREQHGWQNDWRRGSHKKAEPPKRHPSPWTENVWCQRLFAGGGASH